LLERILSLMNERGVNAKELTRSTGLNHSAITNWKKGQGKPSVDAIEKLADYFDVTTDYLLGRELSRQTKKTPSSKEGDEQLFRDGINAYFYAARRKGFTLESIAGLFPENQGMTPNKISDFQMHKEIPQHGEFFRMFDIFDAYSTESPPICHYMLARLYEIRVQTERNAEESDDIKAAALIDELGTALDMLTEGAGNP